MTISCVIFSVEGNVATIELNRPDKLNSFTRAMHAELREALTQVEDDATIRCLVICGGGRAFCAGQDLADLSFEPNSMTDLRELVGNNFNPLIQRIRDLPKPTVAKVHGIAAGAGANLALACDIVVASKSASFLQAFVNIGLLPDSGGTHFLPEKVGTARAMGLAMLGEKLSAEQAANWGLIWQCVEPDALDGTVSLLAKKLAAMPTKALAAIKKSIYAADTQTLAQQLLMEADLQGTLGKSDDYNEGVQAFLQKRPAKFEGRWALNLPVMSPQDLAQACAKVMFEADRASSGQGIELVRIAPGKATMTMTVKPHQTNGLGICHGGFIFMLADSCFAFACNSYNQRAVAAGASIEFIAPAQLGDTLEASATEVAVAGRTGHYEITVVRTNSPNMPTATPLSVPLSVPPDNPDRVLIALFRGRSATIKGQLIESTLP